LASLVVSLAVAIVIIQERIGPVIIGTLNARLAIDAPDRRSQNGPPVVVGGVGNVDLSLGIFIAEEFD
jgi:hypothetical protein